MPESSNKISIRKAERADFDKIYPLLEQLWSDWILEKNALEQVFVHELANKNAFMLCALEDSAIVGFLAGIVSENFYHSGKYVYISTLIVDEKMRGEHIGTLLLNKAVEHAKLNGCHAVELDCNFHRLATHDYYEHYGFRKRAFTFTMKI